MNDRYGAVLDRDFVAQHSGYTADGIEERGVFIESGGGRCLAVLHTPSEPRGPGFVICHAYGLEFLTLRRTERTIARELAALGHPVLAYHSRGYGDSTGELSDMGLDEHLADAEAAARQLASETGVPAQGVIGSRFGALLAGLLARKGAFERMVLVGPMLSGKAFLKRFLREMQMLQMTGAEFGKPGSMDDLTRLLEQQGRLDVVGHPLFRGLYEELNEVDLTSDIGSFAGAALVVQVTPSSSPKVPKDLLAFRSAVEANGGTCDIDSVTQPSGALFAGPAYVSTTDAHKREDLQSPMNLEIASVVKGWMSR